MEVGPDQAFGAGMDLDPEGAPGWSSGAAGPGSADRPGTDGGGSLRIEVRDGFGGARGGADGWEPPGPARGWGRRCGSCRQARVWDRRTPRARRTGRGLWMARGRRTMGGRLTAGVRRGWAAGSRRRLRCRRGHGLDAALVFSRPTYGSVEIDDTGCRRLRVVEEDKKTASLHQFELCRRRQYRGTGHDLEVEFVHDPDQTGGEVGDEQAASNGQGGARSRALNRERPGSSWIRRSGSWSAARVPGPRGADGRRRRLKARWWTRR